MRELFWMMVCLGIAGACSTSSRETLKRDGQASVQVDTHEHRVEGPILELDFDIPEPGVPLSDGKDGLPPHGPVRSARLHGPSTTDLVAVARAQSKEHEESDTEKKSAPSLSCVSVGWLCGLVALGAVYFAIRILRRTP